MSLENTEINNMEGLADRSGYLREYSQAENKFRY